MKIIRRTLYLLFKERTYFRIISSFFIFLYDTGLLRINSKFSVHYFVPRLINKGDAIIDIGANLGYYTRIFAGCATEEGRVWAVEPVPLYREILLRNTRRFRNITILPYALGEKDESLQMGIPGDQPYRHGLTRIIKQDEVRTEVYDVEVKKASSLFSKAEKIDYIKCDIEGYEDRVIPDMLELIRRNKPVIQIEIGKENRELVFSLLSSLDYGGYKHTGNGLAETNITEDSDGDVFFIPKGSELIRKYIIN